MIKLLNKLKGKLKTSSCNIRKDLPGQREEKDCFHQKYVLFFFYIIGMMNLDYVTV